MRSRAIAMRSVALGLGLLAFAAGCSSSHSSTAGTTPTSTPTSATAAPGATSTTLNPEYTPNSIPYVPGEKIGLANGWLVTVTKVQRPFSPAGLPSAPSGQQYVGIDITMQNQGPKTETVDGPKVFFMSDSTGHIHDLITKSGATEALGGVYPPGTTRSGHLVFLVPLHRDLMLALDGPLIGTAQSVWTIVPATVPPDADN
jgi:Domain of unknown function (DUF4352)